MSLTFISEFFVKLIKEPGTLLEDIAQTAAYGSGSTPSYKLWAISQMASNDGHNFRGGIKKEGLFCSCMIGNLWY